MDPNSKILEAAHLALANRIKVPSQPGLCLAFVRILVERAFLLPSHEWYARWRTVVVPRAPGADSSPWARDMEASLRDQRMDVVTERTGPAGDPARYVDLRSPSLRPGDLLFKWDSAKVGPDFIGHVGILMPGGLVLENVRPEIRPGCLSRGPTVLSRAGLWAPTTAIRFTP